MTPAASASPERRARALELVVGEHAPLGGPPSPCRARHRPAAQARGASAARSGVVDRALDAVGAFGVRETRSTGARERRVDSRAPVGPDGCSVRIDFWNAT